MNENICQKYNLEHAWEDITPQFVYATYPPSYPNKTEKCKNCRQLREFVTIQQEIKEWKIRK